MTDAASQVITRLLTFGLNLATARSLTPEAYGVGGRRSAWHSQPPRACTCACNCLVADRHLTRPCKTTQLQVATVQFHLINTTILLISREGFRRACLRVDPGSAGATRRVLRIAALTLPLGALLAGVVTAALLRSVGAGGDGGGGDGDGDNQAYRQALAMQGAAGWEGVGAVTLWGFTHSVFPPPPPPPPPLPHLLTGMAAFVELCAEPLYILGATRRLFGLRVGVETAATSVKGLLTLALLRHFPALPPALAFSWAQLAYAGVTLGGYAAYFLPQALRAARGWQRQPKQQQPRGRRRASAAAAGDGGGKASAAAAAAAAAAGGGGLSDAAVLRLSGTFTLQAAEKLVLAEGSKMAVAAFQGAHDQGVYGLVAGLGSIVVRTLFQPLEEAAFATFSKQQGECDPGS